MTHPSRLEDCHYDAGGRHADDNHGVVIIVVRDPQRETEQLEDVKGVEHFEAEQREYALHRNHNLVVTVHIASANNAL